MFNKHNEMSSLVETMVELLNKYNLSEIEYEKGDSKVRISNQKTGAVVAPSFVPNISNPAATVQNVEDASSSNNNIDLSKAFKSPMVGVVYLKPEPGAKEFVVEGQSVKKGDTLCLIEAMKTFNPVKSPKDGVVKNILIKEAETIEYEQPLFIIE